MLRKIGKVLVGVAPATMVMASSAMAAPASIVDVSGLTVDTSMVGTAGGVIVVGLAALWGFRKLVKSLNRS